MDRKKLLAAGALILITLLIGAVLYVVFFRRAEVPTPPTPPAPITPTTPIPLPPLTTGGVPPRTGILAPTPTTPPAAALPPGVSSIAQGGKTATVALSPGSVAAVRLGSDGRPRYYDPVDGRFYRIGADGEAVQLSDRAFPGVRRTTWAPGDDRAILEFPDGANVLYDFATNDQVTLPKHWDSFSFAPRGDRIAGLDLALDRENRFLFAADPDGNNYRAIEPLGSNANAVEVAWSPNNSVIAFSRTGNTIGDERQQVLAIGQNGENFPGIVVEGSDFRPLWSPDGKRILYSAVHSSNDYNPELWIVDGAGDAIGANRRRLRVSTWADKCTFSNATTLYCAVPDALGRGYGLEPALAARIADRIERIDLSTGARSTIGRPDVDTSIADLAVAPDGASLFYTSNDDGRLYTIRLK